MTKPEIYDIKTINRTCRRGDIVKVLFREGGFLVGVYKRGDDKVAQISNVYQGRNRVLNRANRQQVLNLTSSFLDCHEDADRIAGYQILEHYAQTPAKLTEPKKEEPRYQHKDPHFGNGRLPVDW